MASSGPTVTTNIPIERTSDYRHVVADQVAPMFLGHDFDLVFFASAPRPLMQQPVQGGTEAVLHAEPRLVETVRVRMNIPSTQVLITATLQAFLQSTDVDIAAVRRDINGMIDKAEKEKAR